MTKPQIFAVSREEEESRFVAFCLQTIRDSLDEKALPSFRSALTVANIPIEGYSYTTNLKQFQFDIVRKRMQETVPEITIKLFGHLKIFDLGLLGYALASSGTIGNVLELSHRYLGITTDRYEETVEIEGDIAILKPNPNVEYLDEFQDVVEDSLAGNWTILSQLFESDVDLSNASVHFAFPAPPYADIYKEVFQCPCEFNADRSELRFPAIWLEYPVAKTNWAKSDFCTRMFKQIMGPFGSVPKILQAVRQQLLSVPGCRKLSINEVAEALRLSPVQMRRRLRHADSNYKKVALEMRMTLAWNYLQTTSLQVQEIAYLLDYAEPCAFSRAFKLYFGISATACREAST